MQVRPRAAVQNIFRDLYFHVLWRKVRINRLGDVLTLQVCVVCRNDYGRGIIALRVDRHYTHH